MRKIAWFAGGFGAACLLACYRKVDVPVFAAFGAALLITAAVYLLCRPHGGEDPRVFLFPRRRRNAYQIARRSAVFFLGCAAALVWSRCCWELFRSPTEELAGTEQTIHATVITWPEETSIGGYSAVVRLDGGFRAPDVMLYGDERWGLLRPGDRVTCEARLESAQFLRGDETTYYTARGLFLLGYCDAPTTVERPESVSPRHWPAMCANALKGGIYAVFDETAAPLAAAVTLGDKSGLTEQMYSALNRSGVMHAAVVSGMHISFLSSILLILCGWRRKAALALVPILLFYALMAGGTPSAVRAVIMQTVLLSGPVLKRSTDGPTSLGVALLVLLIQNPFAAASVSLQLSFASVAGILLVSSRLTAVMTQPFRALKEKGRIGRKLYALCHAAAASVGVSLGAMLFTVPVLTLYFGRIPLASPVTNILVLWAVTALMVCALVIGALAVWLPTLAVLPAAAAGVLAHYIAAVTGLIGRIPLAAPDGENRYFLIWLLTVYVLIALLAVSARRGRFAALSFGISAVLFLCAVGLNAAKVARAQVSVTALDVGQGAATLIQSKDRAALVDCGGNAALSAGDIAADRLAAAGSARLDALILTHLDDDHFNGVEQLFWRLEIGHVYLGSAETEPENLVRLLALAEAEGAAVEFVTESLTLEMGACTITLYPPLIGGTSNEEGLFALCSCGSFDALITGDADAFVERMLIKYYPIPDLELLLVGHHGSRHSTCEQLLDALRPELAILSVGYNSYGHPAEETLQRLSDAGVQVYRTDERGSVSVRNRDGEITVCGERLMTHAAEKQE